MKEVRLQAKQYYGVSRAMSIAGFLLILVGIVLAGAMGVEMNNWSCRNCRRVDFRSFGVPVF